jgi:hypothetical protein
MSSRQGYRALSEESYDVEALSGLDGQGMTFGTGNRWRNRVKESVRGTPQRGTANGRRDTC